MIARLAAVLQGSLQALALPAVLAALLSGIPAACRSAPPVAWDRVVVDADPGKRTLEKAIADIDGDCCLDIVVGTGAGVRWYRFPASGDPYDPWIRHDILTSGDAYEAMQILDLSGDGRPDIILSIDKQVRWLEHPGGDGTGTWTQHVIADGIAHELRLQDMDVDGKTDIVTARTRIVAFQDSATSWTLRSWGGGVDGEAQDGMALLDIGSGNGAINIVGAHDGSIVWFENPRETGDDAVVEPWIPHRIGANDTGGPALATMDVDGDGRMDVVQAPNEHDQGKEGLIWWQAPADRRAGPWVRHTIDDTWRRVHWIEVADLNLDGHPDLLMAEQEQSHDAAGSYAFNNDRVAVLINDGGGRFTAQVLQWTGGQNQVAGDVDGDGDLDFVSANHGVYGAPNPIELFVNQLRQPLTD